MGTVEKKDNINTIPRLLDGVAKEMIVLFREMKTRKARLLGSGHILLF